MTLTKITLAFVVIGIALTVTIAPLIVNQAFAAISTVITGQQCEYPAGNQPGGQQPTCTGSGSNRHCLNVCP